MTSSASSEDDGVITIQLEDSRNVQMGFEVDPSGSLGPVFLKYAQLQGLAPDSLRFTFGGNAVDSVASPASLGLGDGDAVRVSLTGQALTEENIARACTAGSVSAAVDLLSEHRDLCQQPLGWCDSDGQELSTPPLYIAIDYAHVELVSQLLPLHKDVINTLKNEDDYSPLQWASWTGNLDIVTALVQEGGAAVDEEALSLAREHGHGEVAAFLLERVDLYAGLDDATDVMDKACREGDVAKVRQLLEEVDLNEWKDPAGKYLAFSPVHLAARHGHMELVQLFAERGMRVDVDDGAPGAAEGGQRND